MRVAKSLALFDLEAEKFRSGGGGVDGHAIERRGSDPRVIGGDFVEGISADKLDGGMGVGPEIGVIAPGAI